MSADNYIGVYQDRARLDATPWIVCHGFASQNDEDCQYRGGTYSIHDTRATALVAAHDQAKKETILEYGVIELELLPQEPCGRCYVCVNDRGIVVEDITRCTACNKPFTVGDWQCHTQGGVYCRSCEPEPDLVALGDGFGI